MTCGRIDKNCIRTEGYLWR